MKIAYFTESLPPNTDGVVNTLCRLVDTLETENVEYLFYAPVKPDDSFHWSSRVRKVVSIRFSPKIVYRLGLPYFDGIVSELELMQPDLIHVCCPSLLGLYGLNYAKKKKIPVVTSYHTHFVSYFPYYGLQNFENIGWSFLRWFHNQCETTYVPTLNCASMLAAKGIREMEIWQRGIDIEHFNPVFRSQELRTRIGAKDKPIILYVGRLTKEKDLDILAQAHEILLARGHDHKLVIVGNGPIRNELHERLPDAHFPGYQYRDALARWYASADIFAFPSTTETFGNVILEAFASGLPTIGVRSGGVADIIRDNVNGYLAQPKDAEDFAARIEKLLVTGDLRRQFSQAALKTARQYSWKEINSRLLQSYQNIIDKSHLKSLHKN